MGPHPFDPYADLPNVCQGCDMPRGNARMHPDRSAAVDRLHRDAEAASVSVAMDATPESAHAAVAALARSSGDKAAILAVLARVPADTGCTDEELLTYPDLAGRGANSIRPRRTELARDGIIVHVVTGGRAVTRTTAHQQQAQAWTINPALRATYVDAARRVGAAA